MRSGELLSDAELREICRKVMMRHDADGSKQILRLDVSNLGNERVPLFNYLAIHCGGDGMLKLDSIGSISVELDDQKRIKTITVVGPPESYKTVEFLGTSMTIPTTKPGWILSCFKAKSCRFAHSNSK